MLIIDEAQNLPLPVLEQIRILSNLETDKEKLLQIILVGQLNLQTLLRSPEMRQLDQRVSIRYELKPLDARNGRGLRRAPPDDRRRRRGGQLHRQGAAAGAPLVRRHPAPDQPDLRSRAARRVLGPRQPHHARDGDARGREPRRAGAARGPVRLVPAAGVAGRRRRRRAAVVGARGRRLGVRLSAVRRGRRMRQRACPNHRPRRPRRRAAVGGGRADRQRRSQPRAAG